MRIVVIILIAVLLLAIAAALYVRLAPMRAAVWHVDPATAEAPASPNFELRQDDGAAIIAAPVAEVAARLAEMAARDGAEVLAGSAEAGFVTYVVRSALLRYPDAVSVRLTNEDGATRVDIFSRSRFGYSDMGVNEARVTRWLEAMTP